MRLARRRRLEPLHLVKRTEARHNSAVKLVLLPGLDATGDLFAPFLPHLRAAHEVISYPVGQALDYENLLGYVRERLPREDFVVVGESFSGPLAIQLGAAGLPQLRGVVLVATFHRKPVSPLLALLRPLTHPFFFQFGMPAVLVRLLLAGWDAPLELVEIFQRSLSKVQPKVVAARVRAVLDVDVTSDLAHLKVPTLYLAARRDGLVRRALREEMQRVLPKIEITDFETAHLILQRAPEEAARVIEEFVTRC